ncbi:signal peptidase I [bacterium]|nr:MAG: signal peptidase I [bacterium]
MDKQTQNSQSDQHYRSGFLSLTIDLIKIAIGALVIVFLVRHFLVQPFFVKGRSMEPNFHDGDYLITNEFDYKFNINPPARGDVIVFKYPKDETKYFIKRIIGLPKETVKINDGSIVIFNEESPAGFRLTENYIANSVFTSGNVSTTLGEEEYYVLGDRRFESSDSRQWGVLDKKYIIGKAWTRVWPLDTMGVIKDPVY